MTAPTDTVALSPDAFAPDGLEGIASVATPAAAEELHPSRGMIHDVWVIARRGLVHMKRQPEALSDATIQPIMFVVLFAYVFGGAIDVPGGGNYREFLMGGIMAQTLVFTAFGVAMSIANDRKNQAVDRFRSLPIAKGAVLGGHAVANVIKSLLPIAIMSLTGLLIGWRIRSGILDAVAGYLLMVAFAFAMIWIGVLLGSLVATPEGVQGIAFARPVPADVHRQHVRAGVVDARAAQGRRPVEPDHDAVGRAARAVRQPQHARRGPATRGRSPTRSRTRPSGSSGSCSCAPRWRSGPTPARSPSSGQIAPGGVPARRPGPRQVVPCRTGSGLQPDRRSSGRGTVRRVIVDTLTGKVQGLEKRGVHQFRGIPYARADRFRPPGPVEPWAGVREATTFGPIAPQNPSATESLLGARSGRRARTACSSTCSRRAPATRCGRSWCGSTAAGSPPAAATSSGTTGRTLARTGDVVVVTINYRLGALGFLHLDHLDPAFAGSGANGIRDQIAALAWVRDNIAGFGGDPGNVTIFGESAGGMSVGTLLGSPAAAGPVPPGHRPERGRRPRPPPADGRAGDRRLPRRPRRVP